MNQMIDGVEVGRKEGEREQLWMNLGLQVDSQGYHFLR